MSQRALLSPCGRSPAATSACQMAATKLEEVLGMLDELGLQIPAAHVQHGLDLLRAEMAG